MHKLTRSLGLILILVGVIGLVINVYTKAASEKTVTTTEADDLFQKFNGEKVTLDNSIKYVKGNFGELELNVNILQPTKSFVQNQTDLKDMYNTFLDGNRWSFNGVTISRIKELFISAGIDKDTCRRLLKETVQNKSGKGYVTTPDRYTKWRFSEKIRANLYHAIGYYDENLMYSEPLIFNSTNANEWFDKSDLSNSLKNKLLSLVYVRNNLCYLSDMDLIMPYIKSDEEFITLIQTLFRIKTVDAYLIVHKGQDVSKQIAYWGNLGRQKQVGDILNNAIRKKSISKINIIKLLPTIPKNRLDTYSGAYEYSKEYKDCHWTTFNFFNTAIDMNYYKLKDINKFMICISRPISNKQLRFGDIVSIFDKNQLEHTCTYIADNLVLTKNGMGTLMPFVITYLDTTAAIYGSEVTYGARTVSNTTTMKKIQ